MIEPERTIRKVKAEYKPVQKYLVQIKTKVGNGIKEWALES